MSAGSVKDSGPAEGTFTLPYIADENADEDPELKVAVTGDSKAAQQLRQVFLTRGKQVCLAAHGHGLMFMTRTIPAFQGWQPRCRSVCMSYPRCENFMCAFRQS